MTGKPKNHMTDALRGAIERMVEENGLALVEKRLANAPFGKVAEMPDGGFVFIRQGSTEPSEALKIWRVWKGPEDRVTSPEVAQLAAKGLADPASLTTDEIKSVCASAVAQA